MKMVPKKDQGCLLACLYSFLQDNGQGPSSLEELHELVISTSMSYRNGVIIPEPDNEKRVFSLFNVDMNLVPRCWPIYDKYKGETLLILLTKNGQHAVLFDSQSDSSDIVCLDPDSGGQIRYSQSDFLSREPNYFLLKIRQSTLITDLERRLPENATLLRFHGASHHVLIGLIAKAWVDIGLAYSARDEAHQCTTGKKADLELLLNDKCVGLVEVENDPYKWKEKAENILIHKTGVPNPCQVHKSLEFGVLGIWSSRDEGRWGEWVREEVLKIKKYLLQSALKENPLLLAIFYKTGGAGAERLSGEVEFEIFGS